MFIAISEELAQDPWFKVAEFLQQNWAVIIEDGSSARVVFYGDDRGVFDEMTFTSPSEARVGLRRNGFSLYREDSRASEFIALPAGEFREREHPNGRIYSSGRFWR